MAKRTLKPVDAARMLAARQPKPAGPVRRTLSRLLWLVMRFAGIVIGLMLIILTLSFIGMLVQFHAMPGRWPFYAVAVFLVPMLLVLVPLSFKLAPRLILGRRPKPSTDTGPGDEPAA